MNVVTRRACSPMRWTSRSDHAGANRRMIFGNATDALRSRRARRELTSLCASDDVDALLDRATYWERRLPGDVEVQYFSALTLSLAGKEASRTIAAANRAAELAGDDAWILYRCASVLVSVGADEDAAPLIHRAVVLGSADESLQEASLQVLANLAANNGDQETAESMLRRAVRLDPDSAFCWCNLMRFLVWFGRTEEAQAVAEQVPTTSDPDLIEQVRFQLFGADPRDR